ncbi:MAG TPA: hypothetical protein ENI99_09325 [Sedimenticola sp.]|nr:hypothetical protein [Sedimenticola sp.]
MSTVKRLVLDVLKPHQPNALEFAQAIARLGEGYRVRLNVEEVDEKTESTIIVIESTSLDFSRIEETIQSMGGSLHSIDEVEVWGSTPDTL